MATKGYGSEVTLPPKDERGVGEWHFRDFRHCDFVAGCVLCLKWVFEKLKLGTSWRILKYFRSVLEKEAMAPEFYEFKDSDEDADLYTSEMDFEINDDDRCLEHVRSFECTFCMYVCMYVCMNV